MSIKKLDIWNQWHKIMSLVIKEGNPIIDNYIYLYEHGDDGLPAEMIMKIYDNHGGSMEEGKYKLQNDCLINMLYFAAVRNNAGIKVFAVGNEFEVTAEELQSMKANIDQLDTIAGYKTENFTLEQFAKDFKDHTIYHSTLVGDKKNGDSAFFALTDNNKVVYYPVFLTLEHVKEFFEQQDRGGYMIIQNNLKDFLSMLDSNEHLNKLGVVIEPLYNFAVGIPPKFRIK
ncbi:MAG: hypothetical protein GYA50_01610 [Eubacteriaceae bacterium]|nr:hypothetical protein [Eubacteriaceae bacterium]